MKKITLPDKEEVKISVAGFKKLQKNKSITDIGRWMLQDAIDVCEAYINGEIK
jgi:hypothetical protein